MIADKESMDEDLQRYISLNTYLDSEDTWFWQKLRYLFVCSYAFFLEPFLTIANITMNHYNLRAWDIPRMQI